MVISAGDSKPFKKGEPGTGERLVEAMLELIEENGGSLNVNLRQVARRVGCAHTNVYNYYRSYQELTWAAFRRGLWSYGEYLIRGLDVSQEPVEYVQRLITNLAAYPEEHPGMYRFIGSDPIEQSDIPEDVMATVTAMRGWLSDVFRAVSAADQAEADAASAMVLAYIDGETLNLINGRVIATEDLRGRVVGNALRLVELLVGIAEESDRNLPDPAQIFGKHEV